jgi:radical SAM protein with 4Fe4S-binding SPASM domain
MAHFRKNCISIFVTNKCNLSCSYCLTGSAKSGPKNVIDKDFARKGITDFFSQSTSHHIRFYAIGEPTTEIGLIRELKEYAEEEAGSALTVELQTNGCFPEATAEWIRSNVDIVWISLDGPPDVHDQYRIFQNGRSTRSLIEKNLAYLLKRPDLVVGVRPTITALNIDRQVEMIDYFHDLGVKAVWSHHQFEPVGGAVSLGQGPVARVDLMHMARQYLVARKRAEELGIFYGNFLMVNFDEECRYACRACLPAPHLTVDGYVSCCDMAFSGQTLLQDFIYGKWDSKNKVIIYNDEVIERIRSRNIDNIPECRDCEVAANCSGGCLGEALYETGDMFGIRKDHCEAVKFLARHLERNSGLFPYNHP